MILVGSKMRPLVCTRDDASSLRQRKQTRVQSCLNVSKEEASGNLLLGSPTGSLAAWCELDLLPDSTYSTKMTSEVLKYGSLWQPGSTFTRLMNSR